MVCCSVVLYHQSLGNDFPGNGTIYLNQTMAFLRPVFINDLVKVEVGIIGKNSKGHLEITTNCFVGSKMVLKGSAIVIPPKTSEQEVI
jgi:3-hydroxybutyryl-CoA dehydratase